MQRTASVHVIRRARRRLRPEVASEEPHEAAVSALIEVEALGHAEVLLQKSQIAARRCRHNGRSGPRL
tara:strand:- start:89 stop:292 length:204 start_codon:yes stop_codon:yes gene_type:complete